MNVFERSWSVAKASMDVVRKDPELLAFPALSGILSIGYALIMLVPTVFAHWLDGGGHTFGILQWLASLATYFGFAFFATFANVCVIHTTRTRLQGGDATFGDSVSFAMSRLPQIVGWALLSASVGLLLRMLESSGRRAGGAGRIFVSIVHGILGAAWAVVTLFVVPAMVYEGVGPFAALGRSTEILKRTWGESLVRHYGMGLLTFLAVLPGVLLCFLGVASASMSGILAIVLLVVGGIWIGLAIFMSGLLNSVYNTALYHYATQGKRAPQGFPRELLDGAFRGG